jgi:hypothetical protein
MRRSASSNRGTGSIFADQDGVFATPVSPGLKVSASPLMQ